MSAIRWWTSSRKSGFPASQRDELLVGLFPGSREREIARLFPMMIETAKLLKAGRPELKFEVPAASSKLAKQIRGLLSEARAADLIAVNSGESHSLMQRACCAVIASGTATLEAAYFGLPYCLVYRMAPLTYLVARIVVKIERIGLVNILAGEEVVEEFIQAEAEPIAVSRSLQGFLESAEKREALQARLGGNLGQARWCGCSRTGGGRGGGMVDGGMWRVMAPWGLRFQGEWI